MFKFANTTCVVQWQGRTVRLAQDDTWHASDPFVIARPEFFADRPTRVFGADGGDVAPVETGTRRPGEKRATRRAG